MSIPAKTVINGCRVRAYGKPFYAADLGLNGGEINGLALNGYIRATGNTKTIMVSIGNHLFKECEIKEWEYVADRDSQDGWWNYVCWKDYEERSIAKAISDAKALLEMAHQLGLEGA